MAPYPDRYVRQSLDAQRAALLAQFPRLGNATFDQNAAKQDLPAGAEMYCLLPIWQDIHPNHDEAVLAAIEGLRRVLKRNKFKKGVAERLQMLGLYPQLPCVTPRAATTEYLEELAEQQAGHELLVVPVQLGAGLMGLSAHEALSQLEDHSEEQVPLGLFAALCIGIGQPSRFDCIMPMGVQCLGDHFTPLGGDDRTIVISHNSAQSDLISIGVAARHERFRTYGVITAFRRS